jgi:hypothetical protein
MTSSSLFGNPKKVEEETKELPKQGALPVK